MFTYAGTVSYEPSHSYKYILPTQAAHCTRSRCILEITIILLKIYIFALIASETISSVVCVLYFCFSKFCNEGVGGSQVT